MKYQSLNKDQPVITLSQGCHSVFKVDSSNKYTVMSTDLPSAFGPLIFYGNFTLVLKYRGTNITKLGFSLDDYVKHIRVSNTDIPAEYLVAYSKMTSTGNQTGYYRIPILTIPHSFGSFEIEWKALPDVSSHHFFDRFDDKDVNNMAMTIQKSINQKIRENLSMEIFYEKRHNYIDSGINFFGSYVTGKFPVIETRSLQYCKEEAQAITISEKHKVPTVKYIFLVTDLNNDAMIDNIKLVANNGYVTREFRAQRMISEVLGMDFHLDSNYYAIDVENFVKICCDMTSPLFSTDMTTYEKFDKRISLYRDSDGAPDLNIDSSNAQNPKTTEFTLNVSLDKVSSGVVRVYLAEI